MQPFFMSRSSSLYRSVERLEDQFVLYGYRRLELPLIQPAELFLTRAGDQVINRLLTFTHHGKLLALRPEFTASAAHAYVMLHDNDSAVVRWWFAGDIFTDGAQGSAEPQQEYSVGAELIGESGAPADAEILSLASGSLPVLAEDEAWSLNIGHIGFIRRVIADSGLDLRTQRFILNHLPHLTDPAYGKAYVLEQLQTLLSVDDSALNSQAQTDDHTLGNTEQMLDVLLDATEHGSAMGGRSRHDIARRLLRKRQRAAEWGQITALLDLLEQTAAIHGKHHHVIPALRELLLSNGLPNVDDQAALHILDDWQNILEIFERQNAVSHHVDVTLHPLLSRNWDYYTGLVFELRAADGQIVGGGGRYDELTRLVGGSRAVPAVGFAYYMDRLQQPNNGANTNEF